MTRLFILIFISTLIISCNSELKQQQEIIVGMEKSVVRNTSDEFLRPLVANYINFAKDFKEDEMTPIYLYRCAVLYYRVTNFKEAAALLERIIRDHPDTEILEDTYLTLAMINATRTLNQVRAEELYTKYLELYPTGKGVDQANFFFLPEEEKIQQSIDAILEENANLPRGHSLSKGAFNQLMMNYIRYVKKVPDGALAASYCLEGAKIAIRLDEHLIAVQLLEKIYKEYPDFSNYPQALLMLAVEYDTNLGLYLRKGKFHSTALPNAISAKTLQNMDVIAHGGLLYKEILERFPDHEVAASAENGLKYLGQKTNTVVEAFVRKQDSIKAAAQPQ